MKILQTTFIAVVSLITAICVAPPLDAKEWNCRNKDMEITCGNDRCGVQPDGTFTPMSIHLDEAGPVEICAYSGCWRGTAIVDQHGSFRLFTGLKLKWNEREDETTDFAIVVDATDNIGILKGAGFAHPLNCK